MPFRRRFPSLSLALALAAPLGVQAGNLSSIDAFYIPESDFKLEPDTAVPFDIDSNGDGYGLKGQFQLGELFFIHGEYQAVDYSEDDDTGILKDDLNTYRVGGGLFLGESTPFFVKGEYIGVDLGDTEDDDEDIDEDFNGYGVHAGVLGHFGEVFSINGHVGYVDLDGDDGIEYLIGAGFQFLGNLGAFVDYRTVDLELKDGGGDLTLTDFRAGARFVF